MSRFLNIRWSPLLTDVGSVWFGCCNLQPPAKVKGTGADFPHARTPYHHWTLFYNVPFQGVTGWSGSCTLGVGRLVSCPHQTARMWQSWGSSEVWLQFDLCFSPVGIPPQLVFPSSSWFQYYAHFSPFLSDRQFVLFFLISTEEKLSAIWLKKIFPLLHKPWCQVWAREPNGLMIRAKHVCDDFSACDRPRAWTYLVTAFKGSSQISIWRRLPRNPISVCLMPQVTM